MEAKLYDDDGAIKLGGKISPLHRPSPWKRPWKLTKDGDLWEQFYKMIGAKSPEAVVFTKVEVHATAKMVEQEGVAKEDKEGNDEADEAAELGSKGEQPKLFHLAKIYSHRQKQYKKLMNKIHKYIISIMGAEKEARKKADKEKNPFMDKHRQKITVQKKLTYAQDTDETKQLQIRELRRQECKDDKEYDESRKVINFLTHTRWTSQQLPQGGITWLELYIWCRMHSPKQPEAPLQGKVPLQKEMAIFKYLS